MLIFLFGALLLLKVFSVVDISWWIVFIPVYHWVALWLFVGVLFIIGLIKN